MTDTNEVVEPTMFEKHQALQEAYEPWIRGEFPEAKCIGDVVAALAVAPRPSLRHQHEYRYRSVVTPWALQHVEVHPIGDTQ